ncbi:MAG: hypothetical protein LBU30_02975 [Candidatus Methanoplasma sp.]|nr:hypothetical protein [Candidatus Methanoplasma sp.]
MNKKIIAILCVVILAIAGIATVLILNKGGDKLAYDDRGRLMIFGNANNDDRIDGDDVEYLEAIIAGDKEKTPLADTNCDGVVDAEDVKAVQGMIELNEKIASGKPYTKTEVHYLYPYAGDELVGQLIYPLEHVAVVGTNVALTLKLIKATDKIECRMGGVVDPTLFSDIIAKSEISDSVFQADFERTMQFVAKNGPLDALITLDSQSYVPNHQNFEDAGIKVVRVSASDGLESISGALTLGYLLGLAEESQEYVEFCDDVLGHIASKVNGIKDDKRVTSLSITMSNYISGLSSDFYAATEMAGSKNLADWDATTKRFNIGDEWLLNEKYDADFLIHMRSMGYGEVDPDEMWETYSIYFKAMGAYTDGGYYLVNGNMPVALRILYMAHIFYPDLLTEEYLTEKHQYCIDNFLENLAEQNYKVADGTFIISMDMISEGSI